MKSTAILLFFSITLVQLTAQQFYMITDTRDGQEYRIVKIGNQWWMAENLKASVYCDGTAIPLIKEDTEWETLIESDIAYCYYGNKIKNKDVYGLLYTWAAAMGGAESSSSNPSGVQGICPEGWHLPSDDEWKQLELYLGISIYQIDSTGYRGTVEGGSMKDTGTVYWTSPNTGATNLSGFKALPGGSRYFTGSYLSMGYYPAYWSSTEYESYYAWSRLLFYNSSKVYRGTYYKHYGFSVRCVKDY